MTPHVILEGVVGSQAYGLDTEDSDEDRLGAFVAPLDELVGLGWNNHRDTVTTKDPDGAWHEAGKLCRLALKCNPTITELLWLDDWTVRDGGGTLLIQERQRFLSTGYVRNAYGGYARSQVERLLRRADGSFSSDTRRRTAKHARHCIRLLWQGHDLLTTGRLEVRLTPRRRALCFELGELAVTDPERFAAEFRREAAKLDSADTVLPEHPDTGSVNEVLLAIRGLRPI